MTSLLFTPQSHCVLVGDGQGRVTVYLVENLNVGGGDQVRGGTRVWTQTGRHQTSGTAAPCLSGGRSPRHRQLCGFFTGLTPGQHT